MEKWIRFSKDEMRCEGVKNKYDLFARARYNIYNVNES